MILGAFALVNPRWRPSNIVYREYENYAQLTRFLPRDIFETRMKTITRLVLMEFPHVCFDSHLFVFALTLVIASAIFAIAARALSITMWYPLCILIIPAIIAYWTTRRRGLYFIKMSQFHDKLEDCLRRLTMMDAVHHVRWSYRPLESTDSRESLGLKCEVDKQSVTLVIEIIQMRYRSNSPGPCTRSSDNDERQQRIGDALLPTYESIEHDMVLDIGPPVMEEVILTSPSPVYTSSNRQQGMVPWSTIIMAANSHTPPPSYNHHQQQINII